MNENIKLLSEEELVLKNELDRKFGDQGLSEEEMKVFDNLLSRNAAIGSVFLNLLDVNNKTPEENKLFNDCFQNIMADNKLKAKNKDLEQLSKQVERLNNASDLQPLGALLLYAYSEELKERTKANERTI